MRIERITVWRKTLPFTKPYWFSGGRLKVESLDSTLIRIDTSDGLSGWGEGCPWGHSYLPAFGGGIRAALDLLAPFLLGQDPREIGKLNRLMDLMLPGHQAAKSPIDVALWDLAGKRSGEPLYRLFGGAEGEGVAINSSISSGTPEEMVALIDAARAKGYRTHSAKVGGTNPDLDVARINAIEEARLEGELITFDVNRAWTPAVAVEVMNAVEANGWFEQPCESLRECAEVHARVKQPLMLDECVHSFGDHLEAWSLRACEGVKVKPNRLGGLTKCLQVRDFCLSVGWRMHIEDLGGTVLSDTAALHLAYSTPLEQRLASWLCHAHLTEECDPAPGQGARNVEGMAVLPALPGLGVEPDADWLGAPHAVHEA